MLEPAAEGFLDDERLTDNVGFLVGWILAAYKAICQKSYFVRMSALLVGFSSANPTLFQ
jgi:hypothetical protein